MTAGAKEQAIAEVLGITATRYYQLLNELIDSPEALKFDPVLVKRLRAQRARRQRIRSPKPGYQAAVPADHAAAARPDAGQACLAAISADPAHALIATDYDGTLAPIVDDPAAAGPAPGAVAAPGPAGGRAGTVAVITGRDAATRWPSAASPRCPA